MSKPLTIKHTDTEHHINVNTLPVDVEAGGYHLHLTASAAADLANFPLGAGVVVGTWAGTGLDAQHGPADAQSALGRAVAERVGFPVDVELFDERGGHPGDNCTGGDVVLSRW